MYAGYRFCVAYIEFMRSQRKVVDAFAWLQVMVTEVLNKEKRQAIASL